LLPSRPLFGPTLDPASSPAGAEIAHSVDEALALARGEPLSVIGGADIFALFLPLADRIELTEVQADIAGDRVIDDLRGPPWRETFSESHPAEDGRPPFRFVTLERA
jgi:dihydrofolate reductase